MYAGPTLGCRLRSDPATPREHPDQEHDHTQNRKHDSNPQKEVQGGNETPGEEQDQRNDEDDDEQNVHEISPFPSRGDHRACGQTHPESALDRRAQPLGAPETVFAAAAGEKGVETLSAWA
jgi:hypothetical protein